MMTAKFGINLMITLLALLAAIATVSQAADEVTVQVSLDRDTIGLDEHAMLQVVVSGTAQNLPAPIMPSLPMFEVYSQGRSSNISIVNGQVSASLTFNYMLLPQKAGTFPIDQIAVVYNNKRFKGNPVQLTVLSSGTAVSPHLEERAVDQSGKSKDYFLEAVVDKKNPYVNEQVTLTLKFYTAVRYYGSPELTEPTTTGFWTEVLGNKAPYTQMINNRRYKVIERKYALFPTQTGELTIGRATIRFTVARRDRRFRDPFDIFGDFFTQGKEVTVSSLPLKINVKPLPTQGRPDDFTGTIGKFRISATPDKREVEVNQPVSVTFKITGTGNIKSVAEPVFEELDDFRIYRASSSESVSKLNDRLGGSKIFEEIFIPKRPGTLEIPAISFSYFDPEIGKYKTVSTHPIKLNVIKPEGYASLPDVPYSTPDLTIGSQARDIRYIKDDIGSLKPIGWLPLISPIFLTANGLPVLVFVALVLFRWRREKLAADMGYARSHRAAKIAKKRLFKAKSLATVNQASSFYA
ncbi:MAG: BatD family protein, partial [Candidatus Zixiibacteriota bacterium]